MPLENSDFAVFARLFWPHLVTLGFMFIICYCCRRGVLVWESLVLVMLQGYTMTLAVLPSCYKYIFKRVVFFAFFGFMVVALPFFRSALPFFLVALRVCGLCEVSCPSFSCFAYCRFAASFGPLSPLTCVFLCFLLFCYVGAFWCFGLGYLFLRLCYVFLFRLLVCLLPLGSW